jgi:hypothetical protein
MLQLEDFALHDQLNPLRNKDNNMPVPIIAAGAAAVAAKKVLPNTIRALRLAAKKLAQEVAKKAAKAAR